MYGDSRQKSGHRAAEMGKSWSNRKVILTVWSIRWTTETTPLFAIEMVGVQGGECEKALWYPSVQGIITKVIRCHSNRIILEIIMLLLNIYRFIDIMLLINSKRTKRKNTSYEYSPYVENDQSWTMACEFIVLFSGHMCGGNISTLEKKVWHWITNSRGHETLLSVIWQPGWEESSGQNEYIYVCGWVVLLTTQNYHNIVNRLCC